MPNIEKEIEGNFNKIKKKTLNKKKKAEQDTSSDTSSTTSSDENKVKVSNDKEDNAKDKDTTSTDTSTSTSTDLQQLILNYDLKRQMEYSTEDLKYASWQFTQDTLKQLKRKAEDLNVHQSQLMRYIVDRALKDYL